jgi:hypothetical protein
MPARCNPLFSSLKVEHKAFDNDKMKHEPLLQYMWSLLRPYAQVVANRRTGFHIRSYCFGLVLHLRSSPRWYFTAIIFKQGTED